MRCTFYVESDVFDPWVEDLIEPPSRDVALNRQGTQWTVVDSWLSQANETTSEACVLLALINDDAVPARRLHRRRKLSSRGSG
jgi:hypothetical protein